ncbi:MAG: MFS transporter [Hyphomicrobium sp.]|uniref:MFS transporter n=1 Tax=Hyphomicrobium sp. TaxID=82 RepID=UPI003D0A55A0
MKDAALSSAPGTSPAWLVVLAAAISAAAVMGIWQTMGLYVRPITAGPGPGREAFGLSIAFAHIIWGVSAPVIGAVADRYGSRIVITMGLLATAVGLITLRSAASQDLLLLAGVFLGLGLAGAGIGAAVGAVARSAPPEEQSSAIAALGLGSAIGIIAVLPITHLLIDEIGWRNSLSVLAAAVLIVVPLVLATRDRPRLASDRSGDDFVAALSTAFASPSFWLINAGFFVCGFHVTFFATYLPSFVGDLGLPDGDAVLALMLVGLGNLAGIVLAGKCGRIMPLRTGLSLIYLGRALVFLGFLYLPLTGMTVILLSGLLGVLWLSTVPLTSTLVVNLYGTRWATMLFGVVFFSHQVGAAAGGWLGGMVFDQFKSYDIMWWVSVGLGLFAALLQVPIKESSAHRPALFGDREQAHREVV